MFKKLIAAFVIGFPVVISAEINDNQSVNDQLQELDEHQQTLNELSEIMGSLKSNPLVAGLLNNAITDIDIEALQNAIDKKEEELTHKLHND